MTAKPFAIVLATALFAFSLPAMAENKAEPAAETPASDAQPLENLVVTRVDAGQVSVAFEYTGGACEEVEPAQLGDVVEGTLAVTFPTISTAEMCTMQAVQIEVEETIAADEGVSAVDVTLTAPDGTVIGTGAADVTQD
jgi:hypothetical protein